MKFNNIKKDLVKYIFWILLCHALIITIIYFCFMVTYILSYIRIIIDVLIVVLLGAFSVRNVLLLIDTLNYDKRKYIGVVKDMRIEIPKSIFGKVYVYIELEYTDIDGKIKRVTSLPKTFIKLFNKSKIDYYFFRDYSLKNGKLDAKMKFSLTKNTNKKAVVFGGV